MPFNRQQSPTDFEISVPGVGTWTFGRRILADGLAIRREMFRLAGPALAHDEDLNGWVSMLATLLVLTVSAPRDYRDIEAMEMNDPEAKTAKLWDVWAALLDKEKSFRTPPKIGGEAPGPGALAVA